MEERLRWIADISTPNLAGFLRCANLLNQIGRDERVHFSPGVFMAPCHCSSYLLFKSPASPTLDEDKSSTLHLGVVERMPEQKFKFFLLLDSFACILCRGDLQSWGNYA